jgi:CBS domain-containing protein
MVPLEEYTHLSVGDSLYDAILAVAQSLIGPPADPSRPRDRGALVLASDGRVVGKLSIWDLLTALEPNYEPPIDPFGTLDDNILWSQWLSGNLAEKARSIKVEDLLQKTSKSESIDEKAPLDLAVHRLLRGKHLSLLVTRGEAIIGILRLSDVFKAVSERVKAAQLKPTPA